MVIEMFGIGYRDRYSFIVMTNLGLEVLVHEVMAAMTTLPWPIS